MGITVIIIDIFHFKCYCIVDGVKSKEKPRVLKGCQSSRSAYMLVYRLRSLATGRYSSGFYCSDANYFGRLTENLFTDVSISV